MREGKRKGEMGGEGERGCVREAFIVGEREDKYGDNLCLRNVKEFNLL